MTDQDADRQHFRNESLVVRNAGGGLATAIHLERRRASRGQRVQYPRSGFAVHAPGFMPGVLTTLSRDMVTIPRVELGGIALVGGRSMGTQHFFGG